MSYIPLAIQGALAGYLAGHVFPDGSWQFWATLVANSLLTTAYGVFKSIEDKG